MLMAATTVFHFVCTSQAAFVGLLNITSLDRSIGEWDSFPGGSVPLHRSPTSQAGRVPGTSLDLLVKSLLRPTWAKILDRPAGVRGSTPIPGVALSLQKSAGCLSGVAPPGIRPLHDSVNPSQVLSLPRKPALRVAHLETTSPVLPEKGPGIGFPAAEGEESVWGADEGAPQRQEERKIASCPAPRNKTLFP